MKPATGSARLLIALIAFAWVGLAASLYYAGHKPFTPALALSVAVSVWRLAIAFWIVSLAGGLGQRILPAFSPGDSGAAAALRVAVHAALGLGLLALVILALGVLSSLRAWMLFLFSLLVELVLWRSVLGWWREWRTILGDWRGASGYERSIQIGVGALLALALGTALAPPLKFDALVYHLALPHVYLSQGRAAYQAGNMYWGMPQTGEMIYTWAAGLAGARSAAAAGWAFGVMALLGIYGFTAARWGRSAGWTAVAALLSGYTFAAALAWGYVDWLLALFGLASMAVQDEWRNNRKKSSLAWAGVLAGMALATKYTGGAALLTGAALILVDAFIRPGHAGSTKSSGLSTRALRIGELARSLLWFGLPAVTVTMPWWIKNVIATGNPFYPFLFPAGAMDAVRLELYQARPPWGEWWEALLLPLRATTHGFEGGAGYSASIGPLLLALAPFAALLLFPLFPREGEPEDNSARSLVFIPALITLAGLLVWAAASRVSGYLIQTRLYFTIFPALAALAGAGFASIDRLRLPQVRLGRVVGALVLLALWLNVLQYGSNVLGSQALLVTLAQEDDQAYLERNLGSYILAMNTITRLPPESQVLMLWEPRSLYCQTGAEQAGPSCEPDEVIDRWLGDRARFGAGEQILQAWRSQGYSHVLFYKWGADFVRKDDPNYAASDWEALDQLLASLPPPQKLGEAYELYSLQP